MCMVNEQSHSDLHSAFRRVNSPWRVVYCCALQCGAGCCRALNDSCHTPLYCTRHSMMIDFISVLEKPCSDCIWNPLLSLSFFAQWNTDAQITYSTLCAHPFWYMYPNRVAWSVLRCVAVCYSVLQCVVVRCSVLQCVAVCCSVLQCVTVCCSVLQCVAVCCIQ